MQKKYELSNPQSCLNKAEENEILFVLLERDPAAPAAIRTWIRERIHLGKNRRGDELLSNAEILAQKMGRYVKGSKATSDVVDVQITREAAD